MNEIVVPGEQLQANGNVTLGSGVYKEQGKVYAKVLGLKSMSHNTLKVIPLQGAYTPRQDDLVVGIVSWVRFSGCFVDLNSAYRGYLQCEEGEFERGDVLMVRVEGVNEVNSVLLTDSRKLYDGKVVEVSPVKIPRVIGRNGSMLSMLRSLSHCTIFVGRNGRIYIKGQPKSIASVERSLLLIEKEAHTSGLTDRVKQMMEGKTAQKAMAHKTQAPKPMKPKPVEQIKDPLAIFEE